MEKRLRDKTINDICSENDIGTMLYTNVIDESLSKRKIRAVMNIIAKALISTLGPDGSTTIIQGSGNNHLVTKDGLDVINSIHFEDDVANTILDLVKSISTSQVHTVGDGSTSAIVVANALLQELTDPKNSSIFKDVSPKVITDMLSTCSDYLEQKLKESAVPVSDDLHEICYIAETAMNNDKTVGKLMQEAYQKVGKYGFVKQDTELACTKDYVEYKKGIGWDYGYIEPYFAEKYRSHIIEHKNPAVFITNSVITYDDCAKIYTPLLGQICSPQEQNNELIIVANNIDDDAKVFFRNNRLQWKLGNPEFVFTVVTMDTITENSVNLMEDLAMMCGCDIFQKGLNSQAQLELCLAKETHDKVPNFVGHALGATITKNRTEIICDDALIEKRYFDKKEKHIEELKQSIDDINKKAEKTKDDSYALFANKRRLSNLENRTAIYHVGAKTQDERNSRERLVEDAILASRSALINGYILGGNITIPKILQNNKDDLIHVLQKQYAYLHYSDSFYGLFIDTIKTSFLASYKAVLDNSYLSDEDISKIISACLSKDVFYNLKTHSYENIHETHIINSTDTDNQIMKSCLSLIGLLSTSNQFITRNCNIEEQIRDSKKTR